MARPRASNDQDTPLKVEEPFNDPLNRVDPLGQRASTDTAFELAVYNGCPDHNNSIYRHSKCFQNHTYRTRGYILDPRCLDADENCLNDLWHSHQAEKAAQAFTIHELDVRHEGFIDSLRDSLGARTAISTDVDWEVGPQDNQAGGFRIDIVTNEKNIFEVKNFRDKDGVEAQLEGYIAAAQDDDVRFLRGTELKQWADHFHVSEGNWDFISGGGTVYVWGYGNRDGHIYFAKDNVPKRVKNKANNHPFWCICVGVPVEVPVAVGGVLV